MNDSNDVQQMGGHSTVTGHYHLLNTGTGRYHPRNIKTGHYHLMKLSNGGGDNNRGQIENFEVPVFHDVTTVDKSAEISNGESSICKSSIVLDARMEKTKEMYSEESPAEKRERKEEGKDRIRYEESVQMDIPKNIEIFSTRALPKDALTYQLETFEKHALLILIQTNIRKYDLRLGTLKDAAVLQNTFSGYGFEVQIEKDLSKQETMAKVKEFSSRDFTDYGCVAVAILTHGRNAINGPISANDEEYSELQIVKHLQVQNKPTLVTKPKLLIIEACHGIEDKTDKTVAHDMKVRSMATKSMGMYAYRLPVESDLLTVHSSYIGTLCEDRKIISGSWFIQSLCTKIQKLASTLDFMSILTEVKHEVALERTGLHIPVVTSTLIRKLHLQRFIKEAPKLTSSAKTLLLSNISGLDNSLPKLPLFEKFGPCSCFLEYYSYITKCLQYFLEDHPDDATAKSLLDVASTFHEGVSFNNSKERMAKAISDYLRNKAADRSYSKYLLFYMR